MSKFIRNLAIFVAGLPLVATKAADVPSPQTPRIDDLDKAVSLRPLNLDMDNLFASHRSHSSHSSHRSHSSHSSHYSGSGASSYVPSSPAVHSSTSTATSPATSASSLAPSDDMTDAATPPLSAGEKLRLQVIRVQIKLNSLRLYDGQVDGVFNAETKHALKLFQTVKGLPETGLMNTPTLNALGISAVR